MEYKKNRKRLVVFSFLFFLLSCVRLFAGGKSEEKELVTQNDEWILCITGFDTSAVSPERIAVSSVIMRGLVEKISTINYRTRVSPEYAYYEEHAWSRKRNDTARALAAKQNERSLLIYKGEPRWRYNYSVSRLDEEIKKIKIDLEEIEKNPPLINKEPVFSLTSGNMEYQFPSPPQAGNEYRFCASQKADAVLTGSISDYHGRFIVTMKLFTVFTRSFVWEDRIIFSHDDLENALEEISRRLIIMLSGNKPAAVAINAQPQDALVLINRSFAGRGQTSVLEFPPGKITVTASSPGHESLTFETELSEGELSQIQINLKPIEYGEVEITASGNDLNGKIYHGALYIGEAPLTLKLPVNYIDFFEMETSDGEVARLVFQTPGEKDFNNTVSFKASKPRRKGQVETARSIYYWSWGGTWLAGIAAWISYYTFNGMAQAYNMGSGNRQFYDDAQKMYEIQIGTMIAAGALAVLDLILIGRYIYVADKGATGVRTGKK